MSPAEIREKRIGLGLTQGMAARTFGVGERTWRRWEGGTLPMTRTAALLLTVVTTVPAAWSMLLDITNGEDDLPPDEPGDA